MTAPTFPDELKPFVVTVKDGGQELVGFEFRHVAFVDGIDQPDPIRIVTDNQDRDLPLEAGAPLNPGEVVTFLARPLEFRWPDRSDVSRPIFSITIDDPEYAIVNRMEEVDMGASPVGVIVREYAPDGTGPFRVFADLTVASIDANNSQITVTVGPSPATSTIVPRRTYTRDKFRL